MIFQAMFAIITVSLITGSYVGAHKVQLLPGLLSGLGDSGL